MVLKKILCVLTVLVLVSMLLPTTTALAQNKLKNTDPTKYYVLLDLRNQIVTVYEKDAEGKYTKVVRRMLCSSGDTTVDPLDPESKPKPTPKGIYKMGGRERFGKFAAFGGTYARYWTQIVGGVFFHSILFNKRNVNTATGASYRNIGRNVSHGCVRLYVEDAKWLYYYCPPGTKINVSATEKSNPTLKRALKSKLSFSAYNAFQKKIYDVPETPNDKAWVIVDSAQVRTGNGATDHALFRLKEGTEIEVLQYADPMSKIKYNGREGYIRSAFITLTKGTLMSRKDADIMRATAYMYPEPDAKSKYIVRIPFDATIKVLEKLDKGWTKIEYLGDIGYVQSRNIEKGWGLILN